MRASTNFALPLAALLFVLVLVPQPVFAGVADCPVEPQTDVPIASGDVYAGHNCTLKTPGDVNSFVFEANKGDTWQLVAAFNTGSTDICLALYDPHLVQIFSGCTDISFGSPSVVTDQKLATTGSYTMVITEAAEGTDNYGVSLERLYPFPPDAQPITLKQVVDGEVTPLTDQNVFTLSKAVTTATYQASATYTSGNDLCMTVYFPNGAIAGSGCTDISFGSSTVQIDYTPPEAGTILVLIASANNDLTVDYQLEVSCLVGKCPAPVPPCTLSDKATYDASSSTLTMNFIVGNNVATTWNAWLTSGNKMTRLFSLSQPITKPPVSVTKTYPGLSPAGTVGILSTLTTTSKGIICSSFATVDTGTP